MRREEKWVLREGNKGKNKAENKETIEMKKIKRNKKIQKKEIKQNAPEEEEYRISKKE